MTKRELHLKVVEIIHSLKELDCALEEIIKKEPKLPKKRLSAKTIDKMKKAKIGYAPCFECHIASAEKIYGSKWWNNGKINRRCKDDLSTEGFKLGQLRKN